MKDDRRKGQPCRYCKQPTETRRRWCFNCLSDNRHVKPRVDYTKKVVTRSCNVCNSDFTTTENRYRKYCSYKCAKESEKKYNYKRIRGLLKKPALKDCAVCGSKFKPYSSMDKYCSVNCRVQNLKSKRSWNWTKEQIEKRLGENNPCYRTGMYQADGKINSSGDRAFRKVRDEMRREMIEAHGFLFCEKCNRSDGSTWETHHIIYRSEKPKHQFLNDKRNLIHVCINCHNWFHKNKGNRDLIVMERKLNELFGDDILDKTQQRNFE